MHRASVPRALRVRASVQIQGTRVNVRVLAFAIGGLLVWGGLVLSGADPLTSAIGCAALSAAFASWFELRIWGQSVPQVLDTLLRHLTRPRRVVWTAPHHLLLTETPPSAQRGPLGRRRATDHLRETTMTHTLLPYLPVQLIDGALLRHDGHAVGLVSGGAPATDLRDDHAVGQLGARYHRILCALDAPLSCYQCDAPPQLADELRQLRDRQARTSDRVLRQILGAVADGLQTAAHQPAGVKQTIWALTIAPVRPDRRVPTLSLLRRHAAAGARTDHSDAAAATLAQAAQAARRFAAQLAALDGTPAPTIMTASTIALLCYQQLDPVRAARYPLTGPLLTQLERVVGPTGHIVAGGSDATA